MCNYNNWKQNILRFFVNLFTLLIGQIHLLFLSMRFPYLMNMHLHRNANSTHLILWNWSNLKSRSIFFWKLTVSSQAMGHTVLPSFLQRKRLVGCGCALTIGCLTSRLSQISSCFHESTSHCNGWMVAVHFRNWICGLGTTRYPWKCLINRRQLSCVDMAAINLLSCYLGLHQRPVRFNVWWIKYFFYCSTMVDYATLAICWSTAKLLSSRKFD